MKTIYRYTINKPINDIDIPNGGEVISVGISKDEDTGKEVISLWVSIDTSSSLTKRRFLVFGTGANMDDTINFDMKFIGTVIKSNMYAFHIYEDKNSIYY